MKKPILLVDDSETVIMFEKMMLKDLGYEFEVARTGLEAVEKATSNPPALIILDIMMPDMDGITACKKLREEKKTKDIPIIMVTTKGNPEKVEEAYRVGCNDFVTKPVDKLELMEKVRNLLSL